MSLLSPVLKGEDFKSPFKRISYSEAVKLLQDSGEDFSHEVKVSIWVWREGVRIQDE